MTKEYSRIKVEPTSGALGAEVTGVDLGARLDDATFEEIHQAWLEHAVLFFRDQRITPVQQTAFAERFGELEEYPFIEALPEHPYVIPVIKEAETKFNFGGGWHSDMSYREKPVKATLLHALDVPSSGGDTLFASMTAAYAALSPAMQNLLDGRCVAQRRLPIICQAKTKRKRANSLAIRMLDGHCRLCALACSTH